MLKKISIFIFVLLITTSGVKATGSCLISNGPSESLKKYFKNNQIIIKNITNSIKTTNEKSNLKIKDNLIGMFNDIINWTGYTSYFKYYVSFPLSNDISKEVKRDYNYLKREGEGLDNFLEVIVKKGYNIQLVNVCEGIETECNLNGTSVEIISKLIKNQSNIIDIYRRAVMGNIQENEKIKNELILVDNKDNEFIKDIIKHYGIGNNCTDSEDSFLSTIWEKIKEIGRLNQKGKDGVAEWKDAWAKLNGANITDEYEEELLAKELTRQGISGNKADAIMGNLRKYNNNGGYSLENNFVSNTFGHLSKQIGGELKNFKTDVIDEFLKSSNKQGTKSISSISSERDKVKLNLTIAESVSKIYNNELPFIEIGDRNTALIRTDIINMHQNLNNSIKTLKDLIKVSEKVCNDQDSKNTLKCSNN